MCNLNSSRMTSHVIITKTNTTHKATAHHSATAHHFRNDTAPIPSATSHPITVATSPITKAKSHPNALATSHPKTLATSHPKYERQRTASYIRTPACSGVSPRLQTTGPAEHEAISTERRAIPPSTNETYQCVKPLASHQQDTAAVATMTAAADHC